MTKFLAIPFLVVKILVIPARAQEPPPSIHEIMFVKFLTNGKMPVSIGLWSI